MQLFKPWPFTEEAMAKHIADTEAGGAISLVAVEGGGSICGHAFIKNVNRVGAVSMLGWARHLILKLMGRSPRPRLGIGLAVSTRGTGLSRELLNHLINDARKMRLTKIALGVHKVNTTARALYEQMGFEIVGELSQQDRNDSHEMELDLR